MDYVGNWHITEMELWDSDYLNMEVEAFIRIDANGKGEFQFGLVSGQIAGKFVTHQTDECFEFTWEGNDECDEAFGSGWIKLKNKDVIEGEIEFHNGDSSSLVAKRIAS